MTFGVQKHEQTCSFGSWCRLYSQGRREGKIQWGSDLVSLAISIIIVNLTQNGLPQLQDLYYLPLLSQCRANLEALCIQSSNTGMAWIFHINTLQRLVNNTWRIFRVHPIIHKYSESYTPFWDKNAITGWISFATQLTGNLHWTRGVTPCKRRWTTTWTWMNQDWLFKVTSTSNF